MAPRLNIEGITIDTPDWTCKVQIVDNDKEQQIRAVVYADDIDYYAEKLTLLDTYLISSARVKVSQPPYGRLIHKFYWVLDKETLIEHVKPTDELEKSLLPPTKLNITTLASIAQMTPGPTAEIDIVGVVVLCGPLKHAGRTQNRCREVTVADDQQNQFMLTLWDDFGEIEGAELEGKMEKGKEFPVILGRNIGICPYQGLSLQTRFNSTAGVFYIEAEMIISDDFQKFCVLECSGCKQKKRTKDERQFDCGKCQRKTTLVPRCTFQIDLIDGSGSTTALISGDLAEKVLSMKADDIFDTTCVKNQLLCLDHAQQMLSNRLFNVQLRKSSWISTNATQSNLTILSYTEKGHVSSPTISKRNIKKAKSFDASEVETKVAIVESESSTTGLAVEPPTPIEKL